MTFFAVTEKPYPVAIRPLTSLRFYAAALIVALHLSQLFEMDALTAPHVFAHLRLGVDFFFILSGFILTHAYQSSLCSPELRAPVFYVKRLARIYPVHLLSLACVTILQFTFMHEKIAALPQSFTFAHFISNLLLVQAWGFDRQPSFNLVAWSVSAEWFMYLLFPLLIVLYRRIRTGPAGALFCFLALYFSSWFLASLLLHKPFSALASQGGLFRLVPEFMLGMGLYYWGCRRTLPFYHYVPAVTVILVAVLIYLNVPAPLVIPLFGLVVLAGAEQERQGSGGFLFHRYNLWLGEISFALYMTHVVFIDLFFGLANDVGLGQQWVHLMVFLTPLACLLLAMFVYAYIEDPARRYINRLAHQTIRPDGAGPHRQK